MARAIDADDLLKNSKTMNFDGYDSLYYVEVSDIHKTPTIDPVKHGRWRFLGVNGTVSGCFCGTCTACGVRSQYIVNVRICPNCGARMCGDSE